MCACCRALCLADSSQDDMDVAPDLFSYFRTMAPLLDMDPTVWCISAWNDNGMRQFVQDPRACRRHHCTGAAVSCGSRLPPPLLAQALCTAPTFSPAWGGCCPLGCGRSWAPSGQRRTGMIGCAIQCSVKGACAFDQRYGAARFVLPCAAESAR